MIIEIDHLIVFIGKSSRENGGGKMWIEEEVIGFAFYGSGDVQLDIHYGYWHMKVKAAAVS